MAVREAERAAMRRSRAAWTSGSGEPAPGAPPDPTQHVGSDKKSF
jgi:hypothetical protein